MMIPPATVRESLTLCEKSLLFKDNLTCPTPKPNKIISTARINLKVKLLYINYNTIPQDFFTLKLYLFAVKFDI